MQLNTEQQTASNYILNEGGNFIVSALAGAGKTTLLCQTLNNFDGECLYVAFMRNAVTEAQKKIDKRHRAETLNTLGHQLLEKHYGKSVQVTQFKYWTITRTFMKELKLQGEAYKLQQRQFVKLIMLVRAHLVPERDGEQVRSIGEMYGLSVQDWMVESIPTALTVGTEQVEDGIWDWDDQIYMPYRLALIPEHLYDLVAIDEIQDLTPAKIELALIHQKPDGKAGGAGDRNQAVMAFSGAMHDSFDRAKTRLEAQEFPLPQTYRCGENICQEVRDTVPDIRPAKTVKHKGEVNSIKFLPMKLPDSNKSVIIARNNAPLVALAMQMARYDIPVQLRAQGLGNMMEKTLDKIVSKKGTHYTNYEDLIGAVRQYRNKESHRLTNLDADSGTIGSLHESCACLISAINVIGRAQGNIKPSAIISEINALFNARYGIVLSTAHSTKGLEWDNVYLVSPNSFSVRNGQENVAEWERQQEVNLLYVAKTRAKQRLTYVESPALDPEETKAHDEKINLTQMPLIPSGEVTIMTDPKVLLETVKELKELGFTHEQIVSMMNNKDTVSND